METFLTWKEREEEITYTSYVKDQSSYNPKGVDGMHTNKIHGHTNIINIINRCGHKVLLCLLSGW